MDRHASVADTGGAFLSIVLRDAIVGGGAIWECGECGPAVKGPISSDEGAAIIDKRPRALCI
jgi:hypothetical protein